MAFDKKNYAEQKKKELQDITNNAVRRVLDFKNEPNKVMELLDFMARSPQYTFKNQMMVNSQYKNSNFTMGSRQFEELMGLKVNENAKPIKIVAPVMYTYFKRNDKLIQVRYANKEEREQIKNKEIKTFQKVGYYKLVDVYDITQTNAKADDYPEYYPNRRQEFYKKDPEIVGIIIEANKKLLKDNGIELYENHNSNHFGAGVGFAGKTPEGEMIVGYRDGLNESEIMHTLLHETTHAFYHLKVDNNKSKEQKEFEAEMTAYVVAKRFGVDTEDHTIKYVAGWTENMNKIEDMEKSIETVSSYSTKIIRAIEKELDPEKIKSFYREHNDLTFEEEEVGNIEVEERPITKDNKSMFEKLSKEDIANANNIDITKLATYEGHNLKEVNKNFFVDSNNTKLTFNSEKNTFYDKSSHKGGNPINFIRQKRELSFPESIKYLNNLKDNEKFNQIEVQAKTLPVSEEEVISAKNKSILDVASESGYSFKKSGKYYIGIEHDSLVLNPQKNTYNWYSKGEYGNPINFIQHGKNLDFVNAVKYLNDEEFDTARVNHTQVEYDSSKYEYKDKDKMTTVKNYLVNKRMLDQELVEELIEKDLIKEDKMRNVVFQWKDQDGNVVGSDKRGTGKTHFRGIDAGSDVKHAFNFTTTEQPKNIYVFESPIDALSYKSLNKEKDGVYVSMNGLKGDAVRYQIAYFINKYGKDPNAVHLCVDNDNAGNKFVKNFQGLISNRSGKEINIVSEQPQSEDCKDWNDVLVENHFNNKESQQTKDYSNVIVSEKNEYTESSKPKKNKKDLQTMEL